MVRLGAVLVLTLLAAIGTAGRTAALAEQFFFSYACTDGLVNVTTSWVHTGGQIQDQFLDVATDRDFTNMVQSIHLSVSDRSRRVNGLEAHSTYFLRVNELVGGEWQPSTPARIVTPCGNTPPPANARFRIAGFHDQSITSSTTLTPPGGTLRKCNPTSLYADVRATGLVEQTDVTYQWLMDGEPISNLNATSFTESMRLVLRRGGPNGGYLPGQYGVRLYGTPNGTGAPLVEGSFMLAC